MFMAEKGFEAVGVDISKAFIEDARRKANEHKVSNLVTFVEGDVRKLKEVLKSVSKSFDVVVNAWTSIGYFSRRTILTFSSKQGNFQGEMQYYL